MNISIIIFCYNEEHSISDVIKATLAVIQQFSSSSQIIIVNDGSTDGSESIIGQTIATQSNCRYIAHPHNLGIGMALRTGYDAAACEFVCAIPGDGQFNVAELLQLKPFSKSNFYSFYRPVTNYSAYRKLLNVSNRFFNRILLNIGLRDVNWIKVYRKDQLTLVNPELTSSIIESEICAKLIKAGCTPIELPSVYLERLSGRSKGGNWDTLNKVLREMFSLYRSVKNFKQKL